MIRCEVDFETDGRQVGTFHVPSSVHDDAWGVVPIPIAVIKNGRGPTVLLEGGNHGDEYEGPITLGELIRTLDPATVSGRLIVIPAINLPAVLAASRTSPVDGLNMNRTFPGDRLGTLTQQISGYVHDTLFPLADAFVDLHSGGSSLVMVPSAATEPVDDPAHMRRNIDAVAAFGAPMTVVIGNRGDPRTSTASAAQAGLTVMGTEMGGGGTVSPEALAICRRGVRNVLAHFGVLPSAEAQPEREPGPFFEIPAGGHVLATADGVFEPLHPLRAEVAAGEVVGRIHFLADPGRTPVDLRSGVDGVVYARRQPGRTRPGNCCMVIVTPYRVPAS